MIALYSILKVLWKINYVIYIYQFLMLLDLHAVHSFGDTRYAKKNAFLSMKETATIGWLRWFQGSERRGVAISWAAVGKWL